MDKKPSFVVFDFGSQTAQLICRRLRELHVHACLVPAHTKASELAPLKLKGIIFSGGPESVFNDNAPKLDLEVLKLNVPILGICYGFQLLVNELGGKIVPSQSREFGSTPIRVTEDHSLFQNVARESVAWMSHGDKIEKLPPGFKKLAETDNCPVAACANDDLKIYGALFHPEVTHTECGVDVLRNFVFDLCAASQNWKIGDLAENLVQEVQDQVGKEKVLCALSGGVDSSVLAALLHRAVGDQLTCVFVDHGLLRLKEREQVEETFRDHLGTKLEVVDASDIFFRELDEVKDPESKRKIIGKLFIDVFEEAQQNQAGIKFLAQGTIYSDVIESAGTSGQHASQIKSHHNVGGLPKNMTFELVEPLRGLFKDEVRDLGRVLGLPETLVDRHPFPGPGLAVRIPGVVDRKSCDLLREADAIFIEELRTSGWYAKSFQAFAVLLPVQSTGVMGDARTYERACALRCVTSEDVMTADWTRLPSDLLAKVSNRIINEVQGINRVVYDISSKPPATIEWE